jgi:hypothetical protein
VWFGEGGWGAATAGAFRAGTAGPSFRSVGLEVGDSKGGGVDQGSGSGDPGGGIGSGGLQSHQQSADYARSLLPCMCARGCEREPQCPNSVSKHKLGGRVAASKIGGGPFGTSMAVKCRQQADAMAGEVEDQTALR